MSGPGPDLHQTLLGPPKGPKAGAAGEAPDWIAAYFGSMADLAHIALEIHDQGDWPLPCGVKERLDTAAREFRAAKRNGKGGR